MGVCSVCEISGDLLEVPAQAIVNPWNRNFVPRWLLVPAGVSGALKKRTGPEPWKDLARVGVLAHGAAVATTAGEMKAQYLIHVAGLTAWWRATEDGVRTCTRNAVQLATELGVETMAMPLIGAGTGGLSEAVSRRAIFAELERLSPTVETDCSVGLDVAVVARPRTPRGHR